ncbi:LOW QUALITY PROTEIN: hypothetical protein PHMEG_0007685 [Phytophthora megakarya]|uniref:Uncharacterized protein n=1 Tax=Phytophthora megakarya TaxID=4795 RepID=A0A225WLU3_9STRA|nr:LOW QUALITY PROTEIN: hypothetical protein PHMEG_0007685 [Phytophthora megakarya]
MDVIDLTRSPENMEEGQLEAFKDRSTETKTQETEETGRIEQPVEQAEHSNEPTQPTKPNEDVGRPEEMNQNAEEDDDIGSGSEPPHYDDMNAEPLTFEEMHAYLVAQLQGLAINEAKMFATDFLQQLFDEVFTVHKRDWLPPGRRRYPELNDLEMEKMLELFITHTQEHNADVKKWLNRLQTLNRAIYKSRSSFSETMDVMVKSVHAQPGHAVNPWSQRLFTTSSPADDVDIKIQNTIKAQVEGDLVLQLYPDFRVYPQFQSRKRLSNEFLLGIDNGGNDPTKVTAMLREAKQICYDQGQRAIHIIFWTREMASKWSREFSTLLFRNRRFPLRNMHEQESSAAIETAQRSSVVWARQLGADGIRNELPRERYHVRLLYLSRYLDEAAIDAYIQANFTGTYYTSHEPTTANQMLHTDTWDIFFKSNHCPQFLEGVRFID